jgi:uncharacterized membrane protein (UPF0127 family)
MSRLLQHFVQRSFKFFLYILFVSGANASEIIPIEKYFSELEIASNSQDRRKGLMFRKELPEDFGMIFVWDSKKIQCMWMRNTFVPLSVAYIDNLGAIIDIYDMEPLSKMSVCSKEPSLYALEVNQGWFKKKGINVGDILTIDKILQND